MDSYNVSEGERKILFSEEQLGVLKMPKMIAKQCLPTLVLLLAIQTFVRSILPMSEARDLTDVFVKGFSDPRLIGFEQTGSVRLPVNPSEFAPAIASAVASTVTRDFPLLSASPFPWRLDPNYHLPKQQTSVPGPLFSERSFTTGERRFNFSLGYSYINFSDLNGRSLDDLKFPVLVAGLRPDAESSKVLVSRIPPGIEIQPDEKLYTFPVTTFQNRSKIDLQAQVVTSTFQYGLTDYWDASISIPIVNTSLRIRNEQKRVLDIEFPQVGVGYAENAQGRRRQIGLIDSGGVIPV